jgi:PleD family two-component response regulator
MIVAVVDDLLFSSKIRGAAQVAGQPIHFVRNADAVVGEIRERRPRLVIFDLDRASLSPMTAIAAVKAQADLAHIPLVGYVSHVHADVIDAARHAGIDQVMARSAFVAKLPQLLASAGTSAPDVAGPVADAE